jgi:hypothetical protein
MWDGDAVMKPFAERLLARLIERHAISEDLARKLLTWRHPLACFSKSGQFISSFGRFGTTSDSTLTQERRGA